MVVLQLIDTLEAGGAERMAVNLANAWAAEGTHSIVCTTRAEGPLKTAIRPEVGYLFLQKRSRFDLRAIYRLIRLVKRHKVTVIHAHSSSFFYAWLVKLFMPSVALIWHDHYGQSENLKDRPYKILRLCSARFDGIISVNELLLQWAEKKLRCRNIRYISNFVTPPKPTEGAPIKKGKHIIDLVCVANIRPQKDHINLVDAFALLVQQNPDIGLHLFGSQSHSDYVNQVKQRCASLGLKNVYFYRVVQSVTEHLKEFDMGVLASESEGLPLAILEYAMAGLPVVATSVGQIAEVVGSYAKLVPPKDPRAMAMALEQYLQHPTTAKHDGVLLRTHVEERYGFRFFKTQFEQLLQDIH